MAKRRFKLRFDVIGLIGIVVGVAGLYTYYKGTNPNLEIVVESSTNVVDVNERIAGLGVVFNGEDLLQKNKSLTIYSLSIRNSGNESVRKGDFDETALVGVELVGAEVLSAQLDSGTTSPDAYVRENAQFLRVQPSRVYLRPLIVDPDVRIGLRVVAIHTAGSKPELRALGKVVGQGSIPVLFSGADRDERGLWQRALGGGLGVNLIRLPIYFAGFLLVLIAAIGIPVTISDRISKRRRRATARRFLDGRQETPSLKWFLDQYVQSGSGLLAALAALAEDPYRKVRTIRHRGARVVEGVDLNSPPGVVFGFEEGFDSQMGLRSGLLTKAEDGSLNANPLVKRELEQLLEFLRKEENAPVAHATDEDPGE